MSISITNFVTIKGYNAGQKGSLLVAVVPKLAPVVYAGTKGKEHKIRQLICTALLDDDKVIDILGEKVDEETPDDRIILVSKEFMRLPRKQKLALLEIENMYDDNFMNVRIRNNLGESGVNAVSSEKELGIKTAAIEKYGRRAVYGAEKKIRKQTERSLFLATWGVTLESRKYAKKGQVAPYLNTSEETLSDVVEEFLQEAAAESAATVEA